MKLTTVSLKVSCVLFPQSSLYVYKSEADILWMDSM